jgi:hypothetical protein
MPVRLVDSEAMLVSACAFGVVVGLLLLWRGLSGYRAGVAIGDTSTSGIATLAAGEVRVTGAIEAGEATLISPLQSVPCVWYRAEVRSTGRENDRAYVDERAVGFRVRDAEGTIRVFPRGARIGASPRFEGKTGLMGDAPAGLNPRVGSAFGPGLDPDGDPVVEREAAIAALLTVKAPTREAPEIEGLASLDPQAGRSYEERRLEIGDTVTIVGVAQQFGNLPDPFGASRLDRAGDPLTGLNDPVVAEEIAEARAAGQLQTPEEAWGNAAIPGFGIGRPVREPELDPEADRPVLAPPEKALENAARFDIDPDTLVLAAAEGAPLLIAEGAPEAVVARAQGTFLVGLLGAALAVGSAMVAAITLGGIAR